MKIVAWTWMVVCLQAQAVLLHNHVPRSCDQKWREYEGRCYFLSEAENDMTWQMAREVCGPYRAGAVLAREDSFSVAYYLQDLMKYSTGHHSYWLGLADTNSTGTFDTWSDGTPVTYRRWRVGRPMGDNSTGRCVVTTATGWVDTDCDSFHPIICQYDLPQPSTTTETPTTQPPTTPVPFIPTVPPTTTPPPPTSTTGHDAVPYDFGADFEDTQWTIASGATQCLLAASFILGAPVVLFYLIAL